MASSKLIGQNYTPPDLVAKVTGRAKYAEDFRADGMLFCKLLLSPLPHARVTRIDTTRALAMPGVTAVLTADDCLPANPPHAERPLTMEPLYQGEPILALAAVDEFTAAEAIERIAVEYEPLPFVVDAIESLRPSGANARLQGNAWFPVPPPQGGPPPGPFPPQEIRTLKWSEGVFTEASEGRMPMGDFPEEWSHGDLEAGFREAALVLDETFVVQSTSHRPLETRSAMAYWQNGKLYLHLSTQSLLRTVDSVARWVGIEPSRVVLIGQYCGGGFGSKGAGAISSAIPALLSKKASAPVMMRISSEEEHFIGRARTGMVGRAKVGFQKDGRITAIDLSIIQDNGPYGPMFDHRSAGLAASLVWQPRAMRFRAVSVLTNTPPRSQQRSPGAMQANALIDPLVTKAAIQLAIDQVAIRRINAPAGKAPFGPAANGGRRQYVTSAFVKEGLDRGAELFKWEERKQRAGTRHGPTIRGLGVAVGPHNAGSIGHDGLMTIRPDGKLYVQSGVGNLGTHSVTDLARVAADVLAMPWEKVEVIWGDTSKQPPWTCMSVGSQTTHAMSRANLAAANDAKQKLQEIAAKDLGGSPQDYVLGDERVFSKANRSRGMSYAQASRRAVELGGKYDGHELPSDIHAVTKASATALAGRGLMGVAKDTYPRDGVTYGFIMGFAEVEVDVETGVVRLIDYLAVADSGTVINPRSIGGQILGGSCLGIGHALMQRMVYDEHYGVALATRMYANRPLTILDVPGAGLHWDALDIPDPETPVGAKGVGEPPVGASYAAVMNAIADAIGPDVFRRAPVTPDIILMSLEHGRRMHDPLTSHL